MVLSQNKFLLITCKYALKLALYFHQNEASIPVQFHATRTEKRHFSMHADARGSLILYILCVEIASDTPLDRLVSPQMGAPLAK